MVVCIILNDEQKTLIRVGYLRIKHFMMFYRTAFLVMLLTSEESFIGYFIRLNRLNQQIILAYGGFQ